MSVLQHLIGKKTWQSLYTFQVKGEVLQIKNHSNNIQILTVIAKTIGTYFVKIKKVHRENKDLKYNLKDKEFT
jgi:hypothetical protein